MGFNIDLNNNQGKNVSENSETSENNRSLLDANTYRDEENTAERTLAFLNSLRNTSLENINTSFSSNNNSQFNEINNPGSVIFENQINNQGFATQQSKPGDAIIKEVRRLSVVENIDAINVDPIYYQNFDEESFGLDSKLDDIVTLIQKSLEKANLSNSLPDILSHEIFKYNLRETSFILTSRYSNDNSLRPVDVFNLKKNYIKNIHEMNAQRFFISCDANDKQKEFHYKNLKESFEEIKSIKEDIEEIITKKDELKKSINYANLVYDFFLENSNSNVFGFVYNNIFSKDNESSRRRSFVDNINSHSDRSFLSYNSEIQNVFGPSSRNWLKKAYDNLLRFTNTRNTVNGTSILNSDKMVGQLLVNASLSDKNIYNNTLGYDLNLDDDSEEIKNFLSFKEVEKFSIVYLNYKNKDAFTHSNNDLTNIQKYNKSIDSISNDFFKFNKHKSEKYFSETFLSKDLESILDFLPYASQSKYLVSSIDEININRANDSDFIPFFNQEESNSENGINSFISRYNDYLDGIKQYDFIGTYKKDNNGKIEVKLTKLDVNTNNNLRRAVNNINSPTFLYFKYHQEFNSNRQGFDNYKHTDNQFAGNKLSVFGRIDLDSSEPINVENSSFLNTNSIKLYSDTSSVNFRNVVYCDINADLASDTIKEKIRSTYRSSELPQIDDKSFSGKSTFYNDSTFRDLEVNNSNNFNQFYLLKNSNNCYSLFNMKEKFLERKPEYSDSQEDFNERILIESYDESNEELNVIKNIKTKNESNNWFRYAYNIKKTLGNLKHLKLENNFEAKDFVDYMGKVREKALDNQKDIVFFHDKNQDNSLYSLEESDLLIDFEDAFYSKNNFIKSNSTNILSTNEILDAIENIDSLNLEINSNNIREFLTFYYPKNFLRNSKDVIVKALKDSKSCLKWDKRFKSDFGYIKLLSDAIVNSDNIETTKFLIFTSLVEKNNLGFFDNWGEQEERKKKREELNKILNYDEHIKNIFGYEALKNQKTYTLRTINKDFLSNSSLIDDDQLIGVIGGKVIQFLFPFKNHVKIFKAKERDIFILGDDFDNSICINRIDPSSEERSSSQKKEDIEFINDILSSYTFNYDAYISKYDYEDSIESANFDIENSACYLRYLSLNNTDINVDDSDTYKHFIYNPENENKVSIEDKISIGNRLNYIQTSLTYMWDYYPHHVKIKFNFPKKIHDFISEILFYLKKDNFQDVEKIKDFIDSNEPLIEHINRLLKSYCQIFSSYFEKINEMMVNIYTNKIITNTLPSNVNNGTEFDVDSSSQTVNFSSQISINLDSLWNESADFYFKEIDFLVSRFEKSNMPFEFSLQFIEEERLDDAESYNSEFINLYLSLITLNNSDCFESLTYDLIHGYLVNLEINKTRIQDINNKSIDLLTNINSLIEQNLDFNLDIDNILDSNIILAKLSKILQNELYYRDLLYKKLINNSNLVFSLKEKYKEVEDFFKHRIKEEESKKILANIAMENIYINEDPGNIQKFDILRFGIDYNLAEHLSNEKLLNIRVHVVNHKFPQIEFDYFDFYYTPMFTDISPAIISSIMSSNTTISLDSFTNNIGFYNFGSKNFNDMYLINTAPGYALYNLIENRKISKYLFESRNSEEIDIISLSNINSIVAQNKMSNYIKNLSYFKNNIFDENKINEIGLVKENILSKNSLAMFEDFDESKYQKVFLESKSKSREFVEIDDLNLEINNKVDLIDNNIHSLEFFKLIDKDISNLEIFKSLLEDKYFDIFSVKISRKMIERKIKNTMDISKLSNFHNSYAYMIEVKVI